MSKILAFCFLFAFHQNTLLAQLGFNRIYDATMIGNKSFDKIFVDKDTIIALGLGYQINSPQGIIIAKIDSFGTLVAQNFIVDSLNHHLTMDFLWGNVIKTTQGHYAFPAIALNRGGSLLLQIDNNLQLKSIFEFQTPADDYTAIDEDMVELSDGGFMILGRVQRPNLKHDGFVRRIDKHGNLLWFNYYGDYNKDETFRCVVKVTDNRFVIGGGAGPNNNDPFGLRAGLWAIDSNGVVLDTWVGPNEPNLILLRGLLPTPDGGFIANGRTYWGEGDWGSMVQVSLMKFDSALQLQWLQHVGPNNSGYNGIYDMVSTPDGHYIVAGERTAYGDLSLPSDDWGGWLYKFSEQGDSIWSRADNAPPGYDATGEFVYGGVGVLSSGSIVAGGKGDIDDKFVGWVVKVTADGCMDTLFCYTSGSEEPAWETGLRVFPNPATTFAQLDFKTSMPANSQVAVHDLAGRRVLMEDLPEGSISHTLQLAGFIKGWYLISISVNGKVVGREKLVILG